MACQCVSNMQEFLKRHKKCVLAVSIFLLVILLVVVVVVVCCCLKKPGKIVSSVKNIKKLKIHNYWISNETLIKNFTENKRENIEKHFISKKSKTINLKVIIII